MEILLLILICGGGYLIAYHTYGRFLAKKIFKLRKDALVPSKELEDGIDYVPTKKGIIFGHHYTSIAGTGPIVGPAIGVIWGWLPAVLWVTVGCIFMGAVHDLGTLVVSMRNEGKSISEITAKYINSRIRLIFFIVVFLSLLIIIAIFGVVIAIVFARFPSSVIAVWFQIPIAMVLGFAVYKKNSPVAIATIISVIAMYLCIWWGSVVAFEMPQIAGIPATGVWTVILLIYAWIASIKIAKSTNPNLWAKFDNNASIVPVEKIEFKGSSSKITALKLKKGEGRLMLQFPLDFEQQGMTSPGIHSLNVSNFLKQHDAIKGFGVSVKSCVPHTFSVEVIELVEEQLDVICVDKDENSIKTEQIDPPTVAGLVPKSWGGETLVAYVRLTEGEIKQTRIKPIERTPYIKLSSDEKRDVQGMVTITMPADSTRLTEYNIADAILGFTFSVNTAGKYKVEVSNSQEVIGTISIFATLEAKQAYEAVPYPVTLQIFDTDVESINSGKDRKRKVVYNLPLKYVRDGDIKLKNKPVEAQFKLIPSSAAETALPTEK